jgi:hypothetical protein
MWLTGHKIICMTSHVVIGRHVPPLVTSFKQKYGLLAAIPRVVATNMEQALLTITDTTELDDAAYNALMDAASVARDRIEAVLIYFGAPRHQAYSDAYHAVCAGECFRQGRIAATLQLIRKMGVSI